MGDPLSILSTVFTFVKLILTAEATARNNSIKVRDLADRVRSLAHLPGSITASSAPALHRLNAALGDAHALVESCQRRRGGGRFFNFSGRKKAARLEDVQRRITDCLLDLNLDHHDKLAENIARQGNLVRKLALDARDLRRAALAPRDQVPVRALHQARQEIDPAALLPAAADRVTATRFSPSATALPLAVAERATATRFAPSSPATTWEAVGFPPRAQGHLDTINLGARAATQTAPPATYINPYQDPSRWTSDPADTFVPTSYCDTATRTQPATDTSRWTPVPTAPACTSVPTFSRSIPSSRGLPPSSNPVWSSSSQHAAMSHCPSGSRPSVYSTPPPSSHTIRSTAMYTRSSLCNSGVTFSASSSTPSSRPSVYVSRLSTGASSSAPSSLRLRGSSHSISCSRSFSNTSSGGSSYSRCSSDISSRSTSYSQYS